MDEHGMENEHLEHRNSSNTEYLPTKCRVTKPPPPKPATNPLQFIKVAPPPLFQKAKEQISKVEKIKKERKEVQDEAEDWQANLDNWKSSRRKLQEHIIERVVEVKKLEHEETGRSRRRSKTFNEILEERGKSKYSIPIYVDESNDWSDYGISDSKGDRSVDVRIGGHNGLGETDQFSSDKYSNKNNEYNLAAEYNSNGPNLEVKLNNNDYNQDSASRNGQYTYEGAIEGYRSRIKSKIDDSILAKITDMPRRSSEVDALVPKGEIVKRKELFDKQLTEGGSVPGGAAKVLQHFENSISIKQRLESLERRNDQSVKLVDNINIVPKVKQISQLFDRPCTDNIKTYGNEVGQNNNVEYGERREKININIVPWTEREITSESPEIYMYMDKHDIKENECQSDDKSSDTFYSGLEDTNYPPSISSTDYMALSSDREDSGIHTADVSCSVSQADDTAEELESNANSHETANDDFHPRQKYFKDTEDNNNVYCNHILMLTKENVTNQTNIELQEDDTSSLYNSSTISSFSKDNIFDSTVKFLEKVKEDASKDMEATSYGSNKMKECPKEQIQETTEETSLNTCLPEIREEILKSSDLNKTSVPEVHTGNPLGLFNMGDPFTHELNSADYMFDSDFPLLPTKMVEPPKVKPPPPPVIDDDKPLDANVKRINSTKRIKNEITLKRSSFLGLSEPNEVENDPSEDILIATPEEEHSRIEEILAKQLYDSKICDYPIVEDFKSEFKVSDSGSSQDFSNPPEENVELEVKNSSPDEDEINKREREIIEMVEKSEKFREPELIAEEIPMVHVPKAPLPASRTTQPTTYTQKSADASYYDKRPDYLDDQDSEVLKVEQELQQLEQEELKRKRDNLLFRQACSKVFAKNKRYSLENIFDSPSASFECRKSMPELQCLKMEKELSAKTGDLFRSDVDMKYRKSVPNIPGFMPQNYNRYPKNEFQTIERYEQKSAPEFQHDVHRSAFEVPARKSVLSYEPVGAPAKHPHNKFIQPIEPLLSYTSAGGGKMPFVKPRNRSSSNNAWLKTRPNIETKSYDQHWLYQEAELRRLQDQKSYSAWQQPKYASDAAIPNLIQRGPITAPPHGSSKSSVRKLTSVNTDIQPFLEHHAPVGPPLPVTQPRPVAVEEGQNRILSVSGKKKCSFCGNELGRGAAMIIETLCLFYHMECFKCCVCHVQLGNGLNGTDVRVRNQKLHCHNCYSSDDGVKFSCV